MRQLRRMVCKLSVSVFSVSSLESECHRNAPLAPCFVPSSKHSRGLRRCWLSVPPLKLSCLKVFQPTVAMDIWWLLSIEGHMTTFTAALGCYISSFPTCGTLLLPRVPFWRVVCYACRSSHRCQFVKAVGALPPLAPSHVKWRHEFLPNVGGTRLSRFRCPTTGWRLSDAHFQCSTSLAVLSAQ